MEIYVGNLPWSVGDQDLADTFKQYGTVDRASVIVERPSGRSKGFGFVTMSDDSEASAAIEALNGSDMGGRPLKVNEARLKTDLLDRVIPGPIFDHHAVWSRTTFCYMDDLLSIACC